MSSTRTAAGLLDVDAAQYAEFLKGEDRQLGVGDGAREAP